MLGVIIIGIVLLAMSKKSDASFVFTNFDNQTGWSDGMAWILGLLQSALSLIGFDVVLHMAEEMPNPARDAPRAMVYAIAVGGVTWVFETTLRYEYLLTGATVAAPLSSSCSFVSLILPQSPHQPLACPSSR